MNFVFMSPHFPPNYYRFCVSLNDIGIRVLGLADLPYDSLRPELRAALTEYYRVDDMHNYDSLVRALGYFTHRYGKIDRIDSQNEYWLETEANLRTDFNIFGINKDQIGRIKRKSLMKQTFVEAGIPAARGQIVHNIQKARDFIGKCGYPVVSKPDIGVGAAKTYKISNEPELEAFFNDKPPVDYIMEEYIQGKICSFDGITDHDGKPVFYTSHEFSEGIMDTVNKGLDLYYYSLRELPEDLEDYGLRTLKAFDVRERFFHFEFFRTDDNKLVACEVNMRPPGGLTTDMFNYANDIDVYREWANIVLTNTFKADYSRKYHCCYVGRKVNRNYLHSHIDILNSFSDKIIHHEQISGVFSAALGDYGYLLRSPDMQEIKKMVDFIQEQK